TSHSAKPRCCLQDSKMRKRSAPGNKKPWTGEIPVHGVAKPPMGDIVNRRHSVNWLAWRPGSAGRQLSGRTPRSMVPLPLARQPRLARHPFAQPVTGHMQPPLDGTDRRFKLTAHLLERTAVNVESHQGRTVDRLELVKSGPQLGLLFSADEVLERTLLDRLDVFQHRWLGAADRTAPRQAINAHALR